MRMAIPFGTLGPRLMLDLQHRRARDRAQPEALRARALSATLRVRDLRKSLDWYRDVLHVTVHSRNERGGVLVAATLVAGDIRLVLEQDHVAHDLDRPRGEAIRLSLTTTQDIDALAKAITMRGGVLESPPADFSSGTRSFSVVDPDGFRLTLTQGFE
jgi:predicted enzyme related to lactoylglutathione lyase